MNKHIDLTDINEYRIVAISDIHGHLDRFKKLLESSKLEDEDYLIVIGDFINRGPDSYGTYRYMKELEKRPKTFILKGNHEAFIYNCVSNDKLVNKFLDFLKKDYFDNIITELLNMGDIDLYSIEDGEELKELIFEKYSEVMEFIKNRPIVVELGELIFVHGGYDESFDIEKEEIKYLKYDDYNKYSEINKKTVIVGHWPTCNLRCDRETNIPMFNERKRIVSIDGGTGIKKTGELNALIITKQDGENPRFNYIQTNDFTKKIIIKSHKFKQEDRVFVSYPDMEFDVIRRGEEMTLCRHKSTQKEFTVFNCLLKKDEENNEVLKLDYINNFFNLKVGAEVEICEVYNDCILVKYKDEFGWIKSNQV